MEKQLKGWMSAAEVAAAFGVSTARIRRLSIDGRLPFQRTPLGRLYPRQEIERLAEARADERANENRKRLKT